MDFFVFTCLYIAFAAVWIGLVIWRAEWMLRVWAARNDLEIVEKKERTCSARALSVFWGGGTRPVYLVTVRDKTGSVRRAWVACGHWYWGVLLPDVKVAWLKGMEDDAPFVREHVGWVSNLLGGACERGPGVPGGASEVNKSLTSASIPCRSALWDRHLDGADSEQPTL
jgi:hypothetical protein